MVERIAIDSCREIIAWLGMQDPTTRSMMEGILAMEEEHADDLVSLLTKLSSHTAAAVQTGYALKTGRSPAPSSHDKLRCHCNEASLTCLWSACATSNIAWFRILCVVMSACGLTLALMSSITWLWMLCESAWSNR